MIRRAALPSAIVLVLLGASPDATEPTPTAQQGAIRSGVTLVPVDVRVLDRNGRPVVDLRLDDFTILEDGIPQPIQQFSLQALSPERPATPGVRPAFRTASSIDVAPRNQRVILVVLGRGRLNGPSRGFEGLTRFVRERLLPQDQIAVLGYNRAADFTADHERIARLLERYKRANDGIESKLNQYFSGLQRGYGGRAIPAHVQQDIDQVFSDPDAAGVRAVNAPDLSQAAPGATRATALSESYSGLEAAWLGSSSDAFDGGDLESMQDLGNLYGGVEYLRYLEGEKHLIYVTEYGIFLPSLDDERSLAAVAADARVAIDIVQVGGVAIEPMTAGQMPGAKYGLSRPPLPFHNPIAKFRNRFLQMQSNQGMREMSRLTGGQAFIYQSADRALDRLDRSTRFQYLLAYAPGDTTWDGRYRRITVKVKRPGVTVLHRHGYFGSRRDTPLDRRQAITYTRIAAAGGRSDAIVDLALTLKPPAILGRPGAQTTAVELTIDVSRVAFSRDRDRYVASLDVAIFCGDKRENVIGHLWQKVDLSLSEDSYRRVAMGGYPFSALIEVETTPRFVKAIVYDYGSDLVGTTGVAMK